MKIFITGVTGYLGSNIARALIQHGHEITSIKRKSSSLESIRDISNKINFYDLESNELGLIFDKNAPFDGVVHTATCYGREQEFSKDIYLTNTLFPLEILEKSIYAGSKFFINTDTVLNKNINTYAISKKHFCEIAELLVENKKIRFINILLEHFYGPNENKPKFVSQLIKKCIKNEQIINLTLGEQERDFIYIDDVVTAYLSIINNFKKFNSGYNNIDLGSGKTITIKKLVKIIKALTSSNSKLVFGAIAYRHNESMYSKADIKKLLKLGWYPKTNIEEGLKRVIDS